MIWTGIAVFLVAWFIGLLLKVGPLANLLHRSALTRLAQILQHIPPLLYAEVGLPHASGVIRNCIEDRTAELAGPEELFPRA